MSPAPATVHSQPQPGQPLPLRSVLFVLLFAACSFAAASANAGPATATAPQSAAGITTTGGGLAPAEDKKTAPKIYKFLSGGTTSFSDTPPRTGAYIVLGQDCYACKLSSDIDWHSTRLHRDEFADEINLAARQFNLDPALVRAVIHAESGFNARARSHKGAIGLMQLMPATARLLGVADARAPSHNIRGGTQYLAGLLARFKNDIVLATAAYNAGPEAVQKYAGVPPYAETQVYVQRVRILHQRYKGAPQV
jgi:soluble lytic murein transglycosylase-like protein